MAIYDAFLSYNSRDALVVELIAESMAKDGNIQVFFDRWDLVPGSPIQETLEQAVESTETCVVFVGGSGLGPWQTEEVRLALSRRVDDTSFRVIPVLLPGTSGTWKNDLPPMLLRYSVLDMREGFSQQEQVTRLLQAITGRRSLSSAWSNALLHQFRHLEDETQVLLDDWKKVNVVNPRIAFLKEVLLAYFIGIVVAIISIYYLGDNPYGRWSLARMFWEALWMNSVVVVWSLLASGRSAFKSMKHQREIYMKERARLDGILQARQTLLGVTLSLDGMHSLSRRRCPKCEKERVSLLACSKARVRAGWWYGVTAGFLLAITATVIVFLILAGRLFTSIGLGIGIFVANYILVTPATLCPFVCTVCGTKFDRKESLLMP